MARDRGTNVPLDVEHRHLGEGQWKRGPGGFGIVPGGGGPWGTPGGVQFSVQAPWSVKPPTATDFQIQATITGATNLNTPAAFANAFTIPQGNVGVVRSFVPLINALVITSDIRWTLREDSAAVPGWDEITINPRNAASVELSYGPDETYPILQEGATVDVLLTVVDGGGPYQASITVHGWYYSAELHNAAMSAYGF